MMIATVLVFLVAFSQVQSQEFVTQNLVTHLLGKMNPDVIPQTSTQTPLELSVKLSLTNIVEVDVSTNQLEVDAWMTLAWNSSLTFDPANFNGLSAARIPLSKMWLPDITAYNGEVHYPEQDRIGLAIVFSSGLVYWVPKIKVKFFCSMSEESLASNTTCALKVGSWTFSSAQLTLSNNTGLDVADYNSASRFEPLQVSAVKQTQTYACCPEDYEHILFTLSFRRK